MIFCLFVSTSSAQAATTIPFTVNLSENVVVTGTPRIAVDVGGVTRYASYTSGTGTSALVFTYTMNAGDVDMDGVSLTSPIDLNAGTIKDLNGNDAILTFTLPNTSNVKVNYPSLGMDFIADSDGRYTLNNTVYNDLTSFLAATSGSFLRGSIGTYINSSGDIQTAGAGVPRFEYDPLTLQPKGILIEESRTNIADYSDLSSGWAGVFTPATLSNAPTPILGLAAKRITSSTDTYGGLMRSTPGGGTGTYTMSVFLRKVDWSYVGLRIGSGAINSGLLPFVDLDTLATTTNGVAGATIRAQDMGSGVVRLSVTWTGTAAGGCCFDIVMTTSTGHESGPALVRQVDVTGVQLEEGFFPTSYIPTAASSVTRAADGLSLPTGGWYSGSGSTLTAQSIVPYVGGIVYPGAVSIDDGTINNAFHLLMTDAFSDEKASEVYIGGANQFLEFGAGYTAGNIMKQGISLATNSVRASMDGTLSALDTSVSIPTVNTLRVGAIRGSAFTLNGYVQNVKYYPARISDTQLQLLTQ